LIDWWKPFGEQSEKVQNQLSKAGVKPAEGNMGQRFWDAQKNDYKAEDLGLSNKRQSIDEITDHLKDFGVKGVKYKRITEDTNNYVMFDDSLIDIESVSQ